MRENIRKKMRKHLILLGDTTGLKELMTHGDDEGSRFDQRGQEDVF